MPAAELSLGKLQYSLMTTMAVRATFYTSHTLLLCEPLGAGQMTSCEHPTAALIRLRQVWSLLIHIGSETIDALDDLISLDWDHLSE